jgi:hypothetical protein
MIREKRERERERERGKKAKKGIEDPDWSDRQ